MPSESKCCPKCGGTGKVKDDSKLGRARQQEREVAGLTLREVSTAMGISISYLCDLEHGRRKWTARLLGKFANAIGV